MRVHRLIEIPKYGDYETPSARKTRRRVSKKPTLLWVDDNSDLLEIYRAIYENLGFEVLATSSPEVAVQFSELSDVVILDYDMPDMNGAALASLLKSRNAFKPIILHTANSDTSSAAREWVDAFCFKGAPREDLLHTIETLLAGDIPISNHEFEMIDGAFCAIADRTAREDFALELLPLPAPVLSFSADDCG